MRIAIIVEGRTEKSFKPFLTAHLEHHLAGRMPKLDFSPYDGRIPTGEKLKRLVESLLGDKSRPADAVIALTDVYTGSQPPEFPTAEAAKSKMRAWVGPERRFHPHVALHDFEAWLLPYWEKIKKLTGSNKRAPGINPETVNHNKPPAHRLAEVYRTGAKTKKQSRSYVKTRDAACILSGEDLSVARHACPELDSFVKTIVDLCSGKRRPASGV